LDQASFASVNAAPCSATWRMPRLRFVDNPIL
jgi:hypothetical protein